MTSARYTEPSTSPRGNMYTRSALAAACCCFCAAAWAEDAEIAGLVKDPADAVVPKAGLKLKNLATALERTTQTNGSGAYSFAALPPARYEIQVSMPGFQTIVRRLTLEVSERAQV